MVRLPDEDQFSEVLAPAIGGRFHVLASWQLDDGGVYVFSASTQSASSAAAERWARDQMLIHHDRGEPDVLSVMTHDEWAEAILEVRRRIGE